MMRQGCHYRTGSVRLASIDLRSFRMTAFWTNCAWSSCRRLNLYQIASTANPFWLAVFVISEVFSIRSHHVIKLNILYIGVAKEFIIVQRSWSWVTYDGYRGGNAHCGQIHGSTLPPTLSIEYPNKYRRMPRKTIIFRKRRGIQIERTNENFRANITK